MINPPTSDLHIPNRFTRRQFVGTSAATSAFLLVPRHVVAGSGEDAPSAKLNIAGIGIGGMGAGNLANLESQNIVALCDVDLNYAAGTISKYPQAKVWTDYREMLEKQKDIDAVLIATPDHSHRDGCDQSRQTRLLPEATLPRYL